MNNPLSTNRKKETEIFRFFILFLKMWKIRAIKKADKMGDSANLWPTPTSTEKKNKVKPFYE